VPRRITPALALALLATAAIGCGAAGSSEKPSLVVSAATSLKRALTAYAQGFTPATVHLSFAGSDMLAAQIEQGVKPDVFASANTTLPEMLYVKGLARHPVVFAANRLIIAVPAGSTKVRSLADLAKPGVTIAIGAPTVPVGSYTRKLLARLPASQRGAILANVRSSEPDVGGVVGKLTEGAVDAGFVYITDAAASARRVTAIELPASLQPTVAYAAAVVSGSAHVPQAQAFIGGLLTGVGRQQLRQAGFQPPPR